MPCSIAAFISGESLLASRVLPAPTPILAERDMSSVSDGFVGQNCSTKFKMLKNCGEVFSSTGVSGLMKSMTGAALGGAVLKDADRVCALYPACTLFTLSRSPGLNNCVRYT